MLINHHIKCYSISNYIKVYTTYNNKVNNVWLIGLFKFTLQLNELNLMKLNMQAKTIILGLGIILSLFSCTPKNSEQAESNPTVSDTISNAFISSSAASDNTQHTTHKFIRTADLKFKVKSVIHTTDITARQGGFVTYTNLTSTIDNVSSKTVSSDSSLETTYYTVSNSITLRVPNIRLDTTFKEIAKSIDFLDYRIIKADDVALQILANNQTQKRSARNEARVTRAIDNRGKRLKETTVAEEDLLSKQEQADNAKIANLSLTDQLKFSTINLIVYQRPTFKRELIPNDKNIKAYEPNFGTKLLDALQTGWNILQAVIIFIFNLWGVILLGVAIYFLYRVYVRKFRE